jgi:hypothetical protein
MPKANRAVPATADLPSRTKQNLVTPPPGTVWISARQVQARYGGRSRQWLERKLAEKLSGKPNPAFDPDFPRPAYSGRLRFFRLDELEQYEKKAMGRGAKAGA